MDHALKRTKIIDTYHGQTSGIFTCSEHLAGLDPSQGTETCTVVETMFSYEVLFSVFGNADDAERVEQLAYNALPASMTSDQWAHVYLQQQNQINSMHCDPHVYVTDGADSNIYGLEPNYGCCTVNFPQGWPKFVSHMYQRTQDNGLAAVLYGPSTVNTNIGGKKVTIELVTDYPFGETLNFTVNSDVSFPFHLRVPSWAKNPVVQVGTGNPIPVTPGQFYIVNCQQGTTNINARFSASVQISRRLNNAVAVSRGPLVYALQMGTQWKQTVHHAFQSYDYVVMPTTPWNYALEIDQTNPANSFSFVQGPVGSIPFSSDGAPVKLLVKGRRVPQWGVSANAAAVPPTSPVTSSSPSENLVLIPNGATQLRIVEFPYINV